MVFLAKTKIRAPKTNLLMLLFCILVIRNCFEFRISSFEFIIYLYLASLPRGVLALVETIQLGRAVTPRGESSFVRLPKRKFKGKLKCDWLKF